MAAILATDERSQPAEPDRLLSPAFWWAAGGYLLLYLWLYQGTLFGDALVAHSDLFEQFLPAFLSPATLWSDYEFSGFPAFADPQNALWYPLRALFGGLLGWWGGYIVAAYLLASCGMYAYVFAITRSRFAALASGLVFGLSEALAAKLPHLTTVHGLAWAPLILLSIEALIHRPTARRVAGGALVFGMAALSGHTQILVYLAYWTGLYALVGGLARRAGWRYWAGVTAMFGLGGLLAAVQLLPVAELSTWMARDHVGFSHFNGFAKQPIELWAALWPMIQHESRETPLYVGVAPLMVALAVVPLALRNWRVAFWIVAATLGVLLALGPATPVAALVYELPLQDRFRVAGRNVFVLAIGASALFGIGIAALERRQLRPRAVIAASLLLLAIVALGYPVLRSGQLPVPEWAWEELRLWRPGVATHALLAVALGAALAAFAYRPGASGARIALLALVLADLVGGGVTLSGLELPGLLARGNLEPGVHARAIAQDLRQDMRRVLPAAGAYKDDVVPGVFARLWRIPSAGGLNPTLLRDYAEMMGIEANGAVFPQQFRYEDRSLDLAAVRFVPLPLSRLGSSGTFVRGGTSWESDRYDIEIGRADCGHPYPGSFDVTPPAGLQVAEVRIVGHLRCAEAIPQGEEFASAILFGPGEQPIRLPLRAGIELADQGLDKIGVAERAAHGPAAVFDEQETEEGTLRDYIARIQLPEPMELRRVRLRAARTHGWLHVDHITLVDAGGESTPLPLLAALLGDTRRWTLTDRFRTSRYSDRDADAEAPGEQDYVLLENERAMPRAWIVPELVPMDRAAALHAIHQSRMPDGRAFDPAATAILETDAAPQLNHYPAGRSTVEIVPGRFAVSEVRVESDTGGYLVVADVWYPGWSATVDGSPAELFRANMTFRAVEIPPGDHVVRFRFVPMSMFAGLGLSALAALLLLFLAGRRHAGGTV